MQAPIPFSDGWIYCEVLGCSARFKTYCGRTYHVRSKHDDSNVVRTQAPSPLLPAQIRQSPSSGFDSDSDAGCDILHDDFAPQQFEDDHCKSPSSPGPASLLLSESDSDSETEEDPEPIGAPGPTIDKTKPAANCT
ncbi:hypothetical protein BDN71DRAFT_1513802 [Pleurotus eryngii]|uniref:Uncharacterized protein n=1 Tax=Pleurotus eryngii TaxID=5323 RepID=A0A9P5ZJR0_PLEER|nr:hypothetical protein BDN71DRAFT_1513802 [Pleurotus eryngii]